MKNKLIYTALLASLCFPLWAQQVYDMSRFGIVPGKKSNMSARMEKALAKIKKESREGESLILKFKPGTYHFYPEGAAERVYYISNHDQTNPKRVGIALEDLKSVTLEGNGAEFVFHGQMIPVSMLRSSDCTLQDFSIDFANPHIAQVQIVKNEGEKGITFRPAPWVDYRVTKDSIFETYGKGWTLHPMSGIAFEEKTRHIVYRTSDIACPTKGCTQVGENLIYAPRWKDSRLPEGTVVAMRSWDRPTPGIFLSHNTHTTLKNVKVHYAQGMGLLAQLCDGITMEGFGVCLKGDTDVRYFTTQADATHFSQCKGKITSVNGLYEGMMDDAINVHGTYLKVLRRVDDHTLAARYMHDQSWGFDWGFAGDSVQFIRSQTMELLDGRNCIERITASDQSTAEGAREFLIRFVQPLPNEIGGQEDFGIENLTWTPEVYFAHNVVRNNRARGALFSTPRQTVVEHNLFDHTSGTAILLCGDCNGWYETGACRDVVIRHNRFVNSLTSMFQFTNAVISIYPEIPDLEHQVKYFHGGKPGAIRITDNEFEVFDAPVLYAKSVDGLVFERNKISTNSDYKPFHWNQSRFLLEKVNRAEISE